MRKVITIGIMTGLSWILSIGLPVFALAVYTLTFTVTESEGNSYSSLPMVVGIPNSWYATHGYITSTGLDTRVTDGDTSLPHLVADDKLLFVADVTDNSSKTLEYTSGNTPLTSMPIITGTGGYVITEDNPALEMSDSITYTYSGWIDTSTSETLWYKGLLGLYTNSDGSINAQISDGVDTVTASVSGITTGNMTAQLSITSGGEDSTHTIGATPLWRLVTTDYDEDWYVASESYHIVRTVNEGEYFYHLAVSDQWVTNKYLTVYSALGNTANTWGREEVLSGFTVDPYVFDITSDSDGNITILYCDNDAGYLRSITCDDEGTWGTPQNIYLLQISEYISIDQWEGIAVTDANDNIHLAYGVYNLETYTESIFCVDRISGAWQAPYELSANAGAVSGITCTAENTVIVTWCGADFNSIYIARETNGTTWHTSTSISGSWTTYDVAMNSTITYADNNTGLALACLVGAPTNGRQILYVTSQNDGVTWSSPLYIGEFINILSYLSLVSDCDGFTYLVTCEPGPGDSGANGRKLYYCSDDNFTDPHLTTDSVGASYYQLSFDSGYYPLHDSLSLNKPTFGVAFAVDHAISTPYNIWFWYQSYSGYIPGEGGAESGSITLTVGSVTDTIDGLVPEDNSDNITWGVPSYLNYISIEVDEAEVLRYQPEDMIYGTTLPDLNETQDGIITWGGNPEGIAFSIGPLTPGDPAKLITTGSSSSGLLLSDLTMPPTMYTELDTSKVPGGDVIDEILEQGEVPKALWWFPFVFIGLCIAGLLIYEATTRGRGQSGIQSGIQMGSLLTMCAFIEVGLIGFGLLGIQGVSSLIPLFPAFLFPIAASALTLSTRWTGVG
jgi:hypothetical protein